MSSNRCRQIAKTINGIALNKTWTILLIGFLSFSCSWAVTCYHGIPAPYIHDEFSYLLAADTFAHGRLSNPPHPFWQHFEAFYVLMQPSYMSKYPPAQGMILALGKILFGHPIWGVWISDGLMCSAICWMLYAWVPPRWALIGGVLTLMQFGIFTYWSHSYMGGALAAAGGALVYGAIPRILRFQRTRDALWLSLGLILLLNTRPLEGVILGVPLGIVALPWKGYWKKTTWRALIKRIILPLGVCLALTAGLMAYYNQRITGNPFLVPNQAYLNLYSRVPMFVWQPLKPEITYRHAEFKQFVDNWEIENFYKKRSLQMLFGFMSHQSLLQFYFQASLLWATLPLFLIFLAHPFRQGVALGCLLMALGFCWAIFCLPMDHYYASFSSLIVLLSVTSLRLLSMIRLFKVRLGVIMMVLLIIGQFVYNATQYRNVDFPLGQAHASFAKPADIDLPKEFTRQELIQALIKRGGHALVFVRYPMKFFSYFDWVYNDADIDRSPIVWARDMEGKNEPLINYFKDRNVYYIQALQDPRMLFMVQHKAE